MKRLPPPTVITACAAALTLAVISGTAGFLVGRYPLLTPYLPVHFGRGGIADRWLPKSWMLVLMPIWVQLSLALAFGAIVVILLWRAHPSASDQADGPSGRDEDARRMLATAEGIALLALVWIAFQALGAVQLVRLWQRGWGGLGGTYGVGVLVAIVLSGAIGVRSIATIGWAPRPAAKDGAFWRLKVLYVNPADPALFVPARWGFGWTLNFGRPAAVVLMALVVILGIGAPILIIRAVTR